MQYADYALWQREVLGSEDDPESLIVAPDRLLDNPARGRARRAGPAVGPAAAGGGVVSRCARSGSRSTPTCTPALVELARAHDATLFMVVHAALAVLLARLSGTDDIAIGTPIAGRGERELDDLIGMFVNTLVLRTECRRPASRSPICSRTSRETDLGAFGHADVPFERLVEVLDPVRSQARNPLFQVVLAFQNLGADRVRAAGADGGRRWMPGTTRSRSSICQVTVPENRRAATRPGWLAS